MLHFPSTGPAGGDLKGAYPNPKVRGEAANAQIADDIFASRFPANFMAPYSKGGIVKQVAGWGGGVGAIVTPTNLVSVPIFIKCSLNQVMILGTCGAAGGVGSCTIDIWKTSAGGLGVVTSAATIAGGTLPNIIGANSYDNSTLTGWTKNFQKGDILVFSLNTSTNFTSIGIWLRTG